MDSYNFLQSLGGIGLTNVAVISDVSGADKEPRGALVDLAAGKEESATPAGEAGI